MKIIRQEESQSSEGEFEVFVQVEFDDPQYGPLNYGHWLTTEELIEYNKKTKIDKIMEKYAIKAIKVREDTIKVHENKIAKYLVENNVDVPDNLEYNQDEIDAMPDELAHHVRAFFNNGGKWKTIKEKSDKIKMWYGKSNS